MRPIIEPTNAAALKLFIHRGLESGVEAANVQQSVAAEEKAIKRVSAKGQSAAPQRRSITE